MEFLLDLVFFLVEWFFSFMEWFLETAIEEELKPKRVVL